MAIIQQIGSYAGLAAVVGLAILSALYFSQARDVKRLREWAGRGPERTPGAYQQRVVAQPVPRPVPPPARPPVPPAPVAGPGARPASAGASPGVARGPYAATPAAARAADTTAGGEETGLDTDEHDVLSQPTAAHPPPRPPPQSLAPRLSPPGVGGQFARDAQAATEKEDARVAGDEHDDDELDEDRMHDEEARGGNGTIDQDRVDNGRFEDEDGGEHLESDLDEEDEDDLDEEDDEDEDLDWEPPLAAPPPPGTATAQPLPPRPVPPRSPPPPPRGSILPPYEQSRPGGVPENERSPAKTALAVGGIALIVAAGAYGVLQLVGGDDAPEAPAKRSGSANSDPRRNATKPAVPGGVAPASVTVSVLNGTTVGGLAAQLGDKLEAQGFQLGNVTNNTDQQRAQSVVLFAPGAEREAKEVGRRLKIAQREPVDADSQTRAGDASVIVIVGTDLNP